MSRAFQDTGLRGWAHQHSLPLILIPAALFVLVVSGFLIAGNPMLGLAFGLAPVALALMLRFSAVRIIAVVVGGMLVLGSGTSDLGANKLVYAGLVLFCAAISAFRLIQKPPAYAHLFKPLIWLGLAFMGVLVLSFIASPAGSDFGSFGRQALFYILIVLGPVIGLDAGREVNGRVAYWIVGILGTIAAIGFAVDWLDRRGVTALGIGRFVLSSIQLPAFAFALALVVLFHTRGILRKLPWLVIIITIPIAMLITGTRTNLIILLAVLFVLGRLRNMRVPLGRMLVLVAVAGGIGVAIFPIVASIAIADPAFIQVRIQMALSVLSGAAEGDQSFTGRAEQYQLAWTMINNSPVFGYGLGYIIPGTLDSPLVTVIRLGWLGTAVTAAFLIALAVSVFRLRRAFGPSAATTAFWGFAGVFLCSIPFGPPLEDRGFGFTILLATLAIAANAKASPPAVDVVPQRDLVMSAPRK